MRTAGVEQHDDGRGPEGSPHAGSPRGPGTGTPAKRTVRSRRFLAAAIVLTALAALQQLMLAVGLGGWLPGWQPWPYLLLAAPAWWLARPAWRDARAPALWSRAVRGLRRVPAWGYLLAALALTAGLWAWFQGHEPHFAHEEAVYANKARSWLHDTPDTGWGLYRPPGLPALGRLALGIHDDAIALRVVALLLTAATLVITYLVAARWTTPRRAAVVVVLLLGGLGFLRRTPEFLNDIGSTGLLLLVVFLLVRAQEGSPGGRGDDEPAPEGDRGERTAGTAHGNGNALLLVPVVAVAAFYLRYGVAGTLLAIALAGLLAYGPRAWFRHGWRLAAAAGLFLAGLLPHFAYAVQTTGSPLGIILLATEKANRTFVGDGFLYYLAIIPYRLAGALGGVILILGLIATVVAARQCVAHLRGRIASPDAGILAARRRVFLGATAVLVMAILGFATDGEPRFVYLPLILLTILGVTMLAELAGRWSTHVLAAVGALATVTVLGTAQIVAYGAMPGPARLSDSIVPVARELSRDGPCLLVTGYVPDMGWYSGCDAVRYRQYREMDAPPEDVRVSFVTFDEGRLQPTPEELDRLIGDRESTTRDIPTDGSVGDATVTTLR